MKKREVKDFCMNCIGRQDYCPQFLKELKKNKTMRKSKEEKLSLFFSEQKPCPNGY